MVKSGQRSGHLCPGGLGGSMARRVTDQEMDFSNRIQELRNTGRIDEAIRECDEALKIFGQFNFFHKIKGDLLFVNKEYDAAMESYMNFLSRIKEEPEYFTNFSRFFYKLNGVKKIDHAVFEKLASIVTQDEYIYILRKGILRLILDTYKVPEDMTEAIQRGRSPVPVRIIKADYMDMELRGKCEEIVYLCHVMERDCTKRGNSVNQYLLKRLELNRLYEQALVWTKKILGYSRDWVVVRTLFRLCRESGDYSEAQIYLQNHDIVNVEEFNVQYELVLYFDAIGDEDRRNKALDCIERLSENRMPICRTLFKFYVKFNMLDRAQNIQKDIARFSQNATSERGAQRALSAQRETQYIVWERLRTLVSEQEHNRQLSAMSELIKGFSHELGQPITNIRYAIQLFYMRRKKIQEAVGQEEENLLDGILTQTERVGKLLNRFSMIFSSKSEKMYFNVYNAVSTTFDEMGSRLASEGIRFSVNGDRDARIYGEELQFSQVFYNLIINSIYAVKKSGRQGKIDVMIRSRGGYLEITFIDNGTGIPAELQRKIFEPFYSTKKRETEEGGEGLGLFIVWNILKLFNGRIYVEGNYKKGARFVIEIHLEENKNV